MLFPVGIHLGQVFEAAVEDGFFQGLPGSVEVGVGLAVIACVTHHQQGDDA